jgi:hypothetical protein
VFLVLIAVLIAALRINKSWSNGRCIQKISDYLSDANIDPSDRRNNQCEKIIGKLEVTSGWGNK